MKAILIVTAIAGIVAVVNLACAAFAYNSARDMRNRLHNQCACTPTSGVTNDCDMRSVSNTSNTTSLISLLFSIVALILVLVTFAVSANPHPHA